MRVIGIYQPGLTENIIDNTLALCFADATLIAHVLYDVLLQVADAQQVCRVSEDIAQCFGEATFFVRTDDYVAAQSQLSAVDDAVFSRL